MLNHIPRILKPFYKDLLWNVDTDEKKVFLTFDDGPTPEVTPSVLEILKQNKVKATFFCVGKQVEKHPDIFNQIKDAGHAIGNHSYSHLSGWKTSLSDYVKDVELGFKFTNSKLFRPPYGRILPEQVKVLKTMYTLVMWDVLSEDYNEKITPNKCLDNVLEYSRKGSIIVFHDSIKASQNVLEALPETIIKLRCEGFIFDTL